VDNVGAAGNTVLTVDLNALLGTASGSRVTVLGIGWDVLITSFGPSWLSEALVQLQDGSGKGYLALQPGRGVDLSGSQTFSSDGILDLTAFGLSFQLDNGILVLAFGEEFNDNEGADAVWGPASAARAFSAATTADEAISTLTLEVDVNDIGVPAPATFLLLLGGLGLVFGRRRMATA
jgi:hypothetical protein